MMGGLNHCRRRFIPGTWNKKEKSKTNPMVVLITYKNKIKLDQDGTLDKLEVRIYTQLVNPQRKKEPTMKYLHLPAVSMGLYKLI
jgi:hypothetical protein